MLGPLIAKRYLGGASAYGAIIAAQSAGFIAGGLLSLRRDGKAVDQVSDLNGLFKLKPGMALALVILIFSVAGVPPAAGFFGKFQVLMAGLNGDLLWLVIIGIFSSAVSLGYYLRLVWAMMMKPPGEPLDRTDLSVSITVFVMAVLAFPVITIGIQILIEFAQFASAG